MNATTSKVSELAQTFLDTEERYEYPGITLEEIESCNDRERLLEMLHLTPACHRIKPLIYSKLERVVLPQLEQLSYDELSRILPRLYSNSVLFRKIDRRMCKHIEGINIDDAPEWFIKLLSGSSVCSAGMMATLRSMCKRIVSGSET